MAGQFNTPEFVVERYAAIMRSGLELATRRAQAVQDYWTALPNVREPKDLMTLQSAFWRRALDDYGAVLGGATGARETPARETPSRKMARAA